MLWDIASHTVDTKVMNPQARQYRIQGPPSEYRSAWEDVPGQEGSPSRLYEDPAQLIRFRQGLPPLPSPEGGTPRSFLQRPSEMVYSDPWGIRLAPGKVNEPDCMRRVPQYDMSAYTAPLTGQEWAAARHFEDLAIRPDRQDALQVQEELARNDLRTRGRGAYYPPVSQDSAARGMAWMEMHDPKFREEHPLPFSYQGQLDERTYAERDMTQPWNYMQVLDPQGSPYQPPLHSHEGTSYFAAQDEFPSLEPLRD